MGRRLLTALVIGGLVAAGAGAAGASNATSSARAEGVTPEAIKLGVTYVDLEAIRDVLDISHGDYQKSYETVIDDLNEHGGIDGRKVTPVFAAVNPIGTAPAQEGCVKLTEDEKVFAVTGFVRGDDPALCFVEQHDTPLFGGNITENAFDRAKAPWYTLEAGDADLVRIIDALVADGAFKQKKLGIIALAADQKTAEDIVVPELKKKGVKGTLAIDDAPQDDVPAGVQQAATILQRFQSDGVKTVLMVSGATVAVGQALARMDYRPRLVATDQGSYQALLDNKATDLSIAKNSLTALPTFDYNDPTLQKCIKMVAKANGYKIVEFAKEGDPDNRVSAQTACRYIPLFKQLAEAAGKNLTVKSLAKAAENIGSVDIPGSGKIAYDKKTHTFDQPVYIQRYDPEQAEANGQAATTLVQDPKAAA